MKTMKIFALLFLIFPVFSVYAGQSQGQALVVFKAPEGIEITSESQDGEVRKYLDEIAGRFQAVISVTYGAISEANGGQKILALVTSETKTTDELIRELKTSPNVLSATPNYKTRIKR